MPSLASVLQNVNTKNIQKSLSTDITTGINKYIPTDTNCYENDLLFEQLNDLVNQKFRAWYCAKFYKLGKSKVLELASISRADGKDPKRLFSYLLKKT